jgi:tetratricopeptide (TPR) repeat protein
LAERGEHEKAERVLDKARALEAVAASVEEPLDETGPEAEDDLIASAERQERRSQAALTPRQVLLGTAVLVGVALLVAGIALVTTPASEAAPNVEAPAAAPIADQETQSRAPSERADLDAAPIEITEPRKAPSPPRGLASEAEVALPQGSAPALVAAPEPEPPAPVAKVTVKSRPKATAPASAQAKEPDAALVEAELASMDPKRLTTRADALYAAGHTGVAASYYRRALEIDPDYAPALVGMGQSILRAKKYSDAMRNASRALQLARGVDARPGLEAAAIYQMGRVHYERGERDAARRLFRQSISLPGTPPEAWFYLGEALSRDNSPAARDAYEKFLELVSEGHLADRARRAIQ